VHTQHDLSDIVVFSVAGRYASFLMQNFPEMKLDVLDLSPFYLAEAKKLLGKYKVRARTILPGIPLKHPQSVSPAPFVDIFCRASGARMKFKMAHEHSAGADKALIFVSYFLQSVTYVEAAAEKVPAPGNEYDAITNVYLFHELPR